MKTNNIDELINLSNKIHSFIYLSNFNNEQIRIINIFLNEYQKALANYHSNNNNELFKTTLQILSSPLIVLQNLDNNNALKNIIINGINPIIEDSNENIEGENRGYARVKKNPNAPAYIPEENPELETPEKINGFTTETVIFIFVILLTFFLISLLFTLK